MNQAYVFRNGFSRLVQMYAKKVAMRYNPHSDPEWRLSTPPPPLNLTP